MGTLELTFDFASGEQEVCNSGPFCNGRADFWSWTGESKEGRFNLTVYVDSTLKLTAR